MTAQPTFSYNSTTYWLKKYPKRYRLRRVMAALSLIFGIMYFTPLIWERTMSSVFFGSLLIIIGIAEIISPLWFYKLMNSSDQVVTMDDTEIKWKEHFFQRQSILGFDQIESYKTFNGQIHFTTKVGKIVKFNHYIIEDEEMQKQFLNLLQERLAEGTPADLASV